jgi:2-(3-amino-3-carboxypropyl)histidine synthase
MAYNLVSCDLILIGVKMVSYDLEVDLVLKKIREKNAKSVMLQFPDGLKDYGCNLAKIISEKTEAVTYISGDPCYGACDLAVEEAKKLDVDIIVHFGHSPFKTRDNTNVIYVDSHAKIKVDKIVKKAVPVLKKYNQIGLIASIQHVHLLNDVKYLLLQNNLKVKIGSACRRIKYDGQVIGCDYTTLETIEKDVDAFLYIGGGLFHALGAALATQKPVLAADPYLMKITDLTQLRKKILRQRQGVIYKFLQFKRIGVIIGVKTGQCNPVIAKKIKKKLEQKGKEAILICLREISPETLNNFPSIEAYVNTACPRVGVDDAYRYQRPIITAKEAEMVLKI